MFNYTLIKTILNEHDFIKIDVPLTNSPEMNWYVKNPFAIGIQWGGFIAGIRQGDGIRKLNFEFYRFEFLYGNLLYGKSSILGIEVIKRITRIATIESTIESISSDLSTILDFIKALPDDLALCFNIKWATPLIDAYFKNEKNLFSCVTLENI